MCTWWAAGFGRHFSWEVTLSHKPFLFIPLLPIFSISLSSDAQPLEDTWEVMSGSPECVHMCVKPHPVSGWWVMTPHSPALSTPRVCVCSWGPRPPGGYLWGSVSRWIEPPLCFTAGLSRTLRSQCMIHYPIRGRVTHPWVIFSNPMPTLSLPDAPSAEETELMGLFLVWRILKIDFTGCGGISHDHGPHLSRNVVGWSHAKSCDSCVRTF